MCYAHLFRYFLLFWFYFLKKVTKTSRQISLRGFAPTYLAPSVPRFARPTVASQPWFREINLPQLSPRAILSSGPTGPKLRSNFATFKQNGAHFGRHCCAMLRGFAPRSSWRSSYPPGATAWGFLRKCSNFCKKLGKMVASPRPRLRRERNSLRELVEGC